MRKFIKITLKTILIVVVSLLILAGSGYFLLRTPSVQTWLTQRIAGYLSYKLNAKVEVQGVDVEFVKKLVLEGFYVEDQHQDTLLYAGKLKADIRSFLLDSHLVDMNIVELHEAK